MKRRSRVSGHRSKTRRPNAPKFKSGSASKQATRTTSSVASEQGENARLIRELNEAREQQTATSEVLRVISSSPGDLQPVFATMLENAVRICDAKFGNIYRWDGDALQLVATHNTPPAFAEARRRSPIRPIRKLLLGRMVATKRWFTSPTLQQSRLTLTNAIRQSLQPSNLGAYGRSGCPNAKGERTDRRVHLVPPRSSSLHRQADRAGQELRRPSRHRHREHAAAQRTAPAHHDLTERTADLTEALEQQTATSEVLQVISSSPGDLQPVFATMLEKAVRICDAKFGNIYRWDGELCISLRHTIRRPPS